MTSAIGAVSTTWPAASAQNNNPMSAARNDVLSAVASQLGITPAQLQGKLQSGQSLSQVAQAGGISSDQLNATITTALQQSNLPPGTDIASLATKMASHVGGHHHHHAGGGAPAVASSSALFTDGAWATQAPAANGLPASPNLYL